MKIRILCLVCLLALMNSNAFAKSLQIGVVDVRVRLSNQVSGLNIAVTGTDTVAYCQTLFNIGGGETSADETSLIPKTLIALKPLTVFSGETSEITVSILEPLSLRAPSRFFNRGQGCELALGLSFDAIDAGNANAKVGSVDFIYGFGLDPNRGIPLISTKDSNRGSVHLIQDVDLNLAIKAEYAGTRISPTTGVREPFCRMSVFRTAGGGEVKVGFIQLDLDQKFCQAPQSVN